MKVDVEEIGVWKRKLKINVPAETIKEEIEKTYDEIMSTAQLPGFRKGKVPRRLVEKKLGKKIVEDVQENMTKEKARDAFREQEMFPLGMPAIENVVYEEGKDLSFEASCEIKPQFELGEYKGIELEREKPTVTDADFESALDNVRERLTQMETVEDAEAQEDDHLVCDAEIIHDNSAIWNRENLYVNPKANGLAGIQIKDLGKKILGAKTNDEVSIDIKIPDTFEIEKFRGQDASIKLKVHEIKRQVVPVLNDELAKKVGLESLDQLHEQVRESLLEGKKKASEENLRNQLFDFLIENNEFEVPEDFKKNQIENKLYQQMAMMQRMGIPAEELEKREDEARAGLEDHVVRDIKTTLIIEKVADKARLFVSDDDLEVEIKKMAAHYGKNPGEVREELEKHDRLEDIRWEVRQGRAIEYLIDKAKITEVEPKAETDDKKEEEPKKAEKKAVKKAAKKTADKKKSKE